MKARSGQYLFLVAVLVLAAPFLSLATRGSEPGQTPSALTYAVVDTGQVKCYGDGSEIPCPAPGRAFYGQDSQCAGSAPSFTPSADGFTAYDNVTGLTWQRSPETDGDGTLDSSDKLTWAQAQQRPTTLNAANYGGYSDWRVPTIKELYSLIDFRGTDPNVMGNDTSGLTPFVDPEYFEFAYGDTSVGERIIDAQYWSATGYVSTTMGGSATQFGVNFADGRIKGYPRDTVPGGSSFKEFLRCVRGNPDYGKNRFTDNGDGTVTDSATGLMWTRDDSGTAMSWEEALAWAQARNAENHLGHGDWRLPNAKELQSLVDYTRSPDTTRTAAIDPALQCTPIVNEGGAADFPWYWSGTTHVSSSSTNAGATGAYVCFGRALGWMKVGSASCYSLFDVHGAGAQRSDPKSGSLAVYALGTACTGGTAYGRGPQGDVVRVDNFVRLVRDASGGGVPLSASFSYAPEAPTDLTPVTFSASASGGAAPYAYAWDFDGSAGSGQSVTLSFSAGSHAVTLAVTDAQGLSAQQTRTIAVTSSCRIDSVTKLSDPFRLKVGGSGFQVWCTIYIDGVAAPVTQFKNAAQVTAKGSGLKGMLPKGVPVQVVVVNPDGTESAPYSFTR